MVKQPKHTMPLLPTAPTPQIRSVRRYSGELDALLVIVPPAAGPEIFAGLPEAQRWQELNARSTPRAGTVRSTTLANRHQTLAVLGYMGAEAL